MPLKLPHKSASASRSGKVMYAASVRGSARDPGPDGALTHKGIPPLLSLTQTFSLPLRF